MNNPTFVIQEDRTDLDQQLHDRFVSARSLVGDVKHERSVEDLRGLPQTQGGEVIFTTIEKFALREGEAEVRRWYRPVPSGSVVSARATRRVRTRARPPRSLSLFLRSLTLLCRSPSLLLRSPSFRPRPRSL